MPDPFATTTDLAARWPSYPAAQAGYATTLLADASTMIRERWPDVDARVTSGALLAASLTRVVTAMVKTAMLNPDSEGLESRDQTVGPFGERRTFTNPNGSLYFTADMVRLLDGHGWKPRALQAWLA